MLNQKALLLLILNIVRIITGKKNVLNIKIKNVFSGFDIGNHFCEFMLDYKSATEWPFFKIDFTQYPNENQQVKL